MASEQIPDWTILSIFCAEFGNMKLCVPEMIHSKKQHGVTILDFLQFCKVLDFNSRISNCLMIWECARRWIVSLIPLAYTYACTCYSGENVALHVELPNSFQMNCPYFLPILMLEYVSS